MPVPDTRPQVTALPGIPGAGKTALPNTREGRRVPAFAAADMDKAVIPAALKSAAAGTGTAFAPHQWADPPDRFPGWRHAV